MFLAVPPDVFKLFQGVGALAWQCDEVTHAACMDGRAMLLCYACLVASFRN